MNALFPDDATPICLHEVEEEHDVHRQRALTLWFKVRDTAESKLR